MPSDLLIFSPPSVTTMPECAQRRAKRLAGGDRLGPLVLVMGEGQIQAAAVEVEARTEQVQGHDDALGVPARAARSPGRVPAGLTLPGVLPEGEVDGDALARLLIHLHPGAHPQAVQGLVGQQAITVDALGREVHAVTPDIGVARGDQVGDQVLHVLHVGGGMRDVRRPLDAQPGHGVPPHLLVLGCHLLGRPPFQRRPGDDLVVDVGDVRDEAHVQPRPGQVPPQHVPRHVEAAVTEVGLVVHRRPAHVHRHPARITEARGVPRRPMRCRAGAARQYRSGIMPNAVPDKPSLDGLEQKWGPRWEADGRVPVRPAGAPGAGLLDRHAPLDGERVAAHRPRVLLHPHRHHGPVQAHAGLPGLLSHGVGRQRTGHRAPGAELLRGALRPLVAVRGGVRAPRPGRPGPRTGAGAGVAAQLRGAVREPGRRGREGVRRGVAAAGAVGRLVPVLHHHLAGDPPGVAAGLPAQPGPGRGLHGRGADALGCRLPDRRRPGRAGGP